MKKLILGFWILLCGFAPNLNNCNTIEDCGFQASADSNDTATIQHTAQGSFLYTSLDHLTDTVKWRTEVVPQPEGGKWAAYGVVKNYAFRLYIPTTWTVDSYPEIITQWHSEPDRDLNEHSPGSPPLALQIGRDNGGNHYWLRVHASQDRLIQFDANNKPIYSVNAWYDLGTVNGDIGKLTRWQFSVLWDYNTAGLGEILVRKNGVTVAHIFGANCYNDAYGPWWKIGVYKWDWKRPVVNSPVTKREYWYTEISEN